ncbi:T9SS type A sorting domain-containing protein [Tenacibaculum sp. M341]|uniref:T9SS type A sorting domain-containing protein n=1 Tax=Tenacibaculum sp. M341 TaxID=2530339 RepID=UPI00105112C5|nr:T9SS type A sorting domain-containing protein [Tenacibaculum sp. M341]TCI84734.1 T9SS type A sorting domain-containing protein [Tenacibaculum sp. M341]
MKKIYTFAFLLFVSLFVKAQTNLVPNGGVENWTDATTLDDWITENNVSQNTTDVVEGSSSATLTIGADDIRPKILAKVPMEMNVEYNVSYRFKYVDSNFGGTHPVSLRIIRSGSATTISSNRFASNNNWIEVSTTFTPDQTGDYDLSISTATFDSEGFTVLIDDVKVVEPVEEIVNIPDANFKNALLNYSPTFDTSGDGEIQVSEAESALNALRLNNKNISDLTGIEYFVNIRELSCEENNITSLNLEKNTKLVKLFCGNNSNLTTINITNCPQLEDISAGNTSLNSIDLSNNTLLEELFLQNGNLTSLNVSSCTKLNYLNCSSNQIESLDLIANSDITTLRAGYNNLTRIDISNCTLLPELYLDNNQLTNIDISSNINLTQILLRNNNLTSIDVSNNTKLSSIDLRDNNLTAVDVSSLEDLVTFQVGYNEITSVDISNNKKLTHISVEDNNLSQLNLKNGNNVNFVTAFLANNPNLFCIQLDDNFTPPESYYWQKDTKAAYSDNCSLDNILIIPDSNFKEKLIAEIDINVNSDDEIQLYEARNYQGAISVAGSDISDLTGIEEFYNIDDLFCEDNNITSIDLSNNTNLGRLHILNNNISSIDLSNLPRLYNLVCRNNKLTALDVSNNPDLTWISCGDNELENLDLSNNILLRDLDFDNTKIQNLDVTNNIELERLRGLGSTLLTSIDVSGLTKLKQFIFGNSGLTTLDFSTNSSLEEVYVHSNEISSINLSNCQNLKKLEVYNNKLTSLDLVDNINLIELFASENLIENVNLLSNTLIDLIDLTNNKLSEIDITGNTKLTRFYCGLNDITSIDVSQNVDLKDLFLLGNELTELDLSNNKELLYVNCGDNLLESLNVKNDNNTILNELNASGNTSLSCIQVDDKDFADNNSSWRKDSTANYSEDCSATASINDEELSNNLIVSPNPVQDFLTVKSNNFTVVKEIEIVDLLGKEILQTKETSINVSHLPKGMYLMKITSENNRVGVKKFIKE